MAPALADIERKILDYMVQYLRTNTYQPSIREIGQQFGIKSTKTVSEHLQAMAEKGFLERDPSRSRGVRILGVDLNAQTVSIPCFRVLPNDRGGLRTDTAEMFLSMDRRLIGSPGGFFVRAAGEELSPIGILHGDHVLIEPVGIDELQEGAVVAARISQVGSYYRFSRSNGHGIFLSEMLGTAPPTVIEDPSQLTLLGRVAAVYRRLEALPVAISTVAH